MELATVIDPPEGHDTVEREPLKVTRLLPPPPPPLPERERVAAAAWRASSACCLRIWSESWASRASRLAASLRAWSRRFCTSSAQAAVASGGVAEGQEV